jgi:hypothetical protein
MLKESEPMQYLSFVRVQEGKICRTISISSPRLLSPCGGMTRYPLISLTTGSEEKSFVES